MTARFTAKTRKEAWGTGLQLAPDLWRLRLRHPRARAATRIIVNTYIYRGGQTCAVIDPGWPGTVDALEAALRDLGIAQSLAEVDAWLYTHAHIDHMGAAALLEKRSDAPHIAWRGLLPRVADWHAFQDEVQDWRPWIARAFVDPHRTHLLAARPSRGLQHQFGPGAITRADFIDFGETIQIGDLSLEFVDARGHDPHHGAFFERERGWLFAGDVALAVPTPICRAMNDDLGAYRDSLDRLAGLPVSFLLPGHGLHRRDADVDRVFERARAFVDQYTSATLNALRLAAGPADLYQLALLATPDQQRLTPDARWWVHLALVDAHLQDQVARGRAERIAGTDGPLYRGAPS